VFICDISDVRGTRRTQQGDARTLKLCPASLHLAKRKSPINPSLHLRFAVLKRLLGEMESIVASVLLLAACLSFTHLARADGDHDHAHDPQSLTRTQQARNGATGCVRVGTR
jgi:hypothetical protein